MSRSIDFADLAAGAFGCVREGEDGAPVGWLSTSGELSGIEVRGRGPALSLSAGPQLALGLEPVLGPVELDGGGQEWICRASGSVDGAEFTGLARVASGERPSGGSAPLRSLSVWIDPELAFVCRGSGPDPERGALEVWVLRAGVEASPVEDPRLSTAYDADGAHMRAALELWEGEESDFPLRLAGERVASTRLLLGGMQLDCAFMRWEHAGRIGAGCYELASAAT